MGYFMQLSLSNDVQDLAPFIFKGQLSPEGRDLFRKIIYAYYAHNKRLFSWRDIDDPYRVVVSEIMLQQTQTDRVKVKYEQFVQEFPTLEVLAAAPVAKVIAAWQGLGYNRRALALHLFAQRIVSEYAGRIPDNPELLRLFRGIGPATGASICAFAFNKPTVFIETNIRAVYIHCFFAGRSEVKDSEIMPLVEQTLDSLNPRMWYYALMDYGVMLKKKHKNPSRKSAHHAVQSKFEGSDRQVRGLILKLLVQTPVMHTELFLEQIQREPDKIMRILNELEKEGFVLQNNNHYSLSRD